jgi:hypothetical protein
VKQQPTLKFNQLTDKNIRGTIDDIQKFIQNDKIASSRFLIRKFQGQGEWPDEYLSYVTSENRNNLYRRYIFKA